MVHILINTEVEDYNKWKEAFTNGKKDREEAGIHEESVFQEVDDPNNVKIFFKADSLEKAMRLLTSEKLKKINKEVGVKENPSVSFLKEDGDLAN